MTNKLKLFSLLLFISCKKDSNSPSDENLFKEISETGYSYYQNGDILTAASASPHGAFKLRFNKIAQDALDATGELPSGATFPDGSVIVKDVYNNGSLDLYAIMKKSTDANAGSGWLWSEYKPDGSVVYSISKKGDACISCHNSGVTRDLVRTFDLH
jgi:hypothetical protein